MIHLSCQLLALASLVQGLEFLKLRPFYEDKGIWRWSDLAPELKDIKIHIFLSPFLQGRSFYVLNIIRVILAVAFFIFPHAVYGVALFLIHLFTLIRWRGSFNGGSDSMYLLVLGSINMALIFSGSKIISLAAMTYITMQLIISYFKAGILKLKNSDWRNGQALRDFLASSSYSPTSLVSSLSGSPRTTLALSWIILIFEVLFPLALLNSQLAVLFMVLGVFFHLGNIYFFGLNRFFWNWVCAYPSLYFVSHYLNETSGLLKIF